MPTATIITSTGPRWGNSAFNSSTASLKVGKSGTSSYYGYVGFPRLNPAWYIKSIKLRMKREDTYSTKVLQFGSNQSSAWDDKGSLQWAKDYSIPSGTGTKEWDLTAYKTILQGYAGTWYLQVRHGSGENSYCEFAGGTVSSSPRLVIEYEEASLSVPGEQFTIGAATAITVGTAGSGLTHKLSYSIGTASGVIMNSITAGVVINWTPSTTLAAQIMDAMAGMVTLTLESYLAGVLSSTLTFTYTLNIPASYVPAISTATFALSNPSGDIGIYVQGRSRTVLTISATAPGGASIREYRLTLAGKTYSSASNVITTALLTAAGALTATVVVVDSRGQSATLTKTSAVTVQPYTAPMITSFSVARCLSDGTLSNSGTYVKYTLACVFSALSNLNTRAGSIKYKVAGGTFSAPVSLTSAMTALGTVFSFTLTGVLGGGAIGSGSYVVSASLTDRYNTTTDEAELASRTIWFDLHGSGEGVAVGKVAETAGLFDVGIKANFDQAVQMGKGFNVHTARATMGSIGWIQICRLTITAAYTNCPIEIVLAQRGLGMPSRLFISFVNFNGTDPALGSFTYTGNIKSAYIVRAAAGVWDVYVEKTESYDAVGVVDFRSPLYMAGVTVAWTDAQVASVPAGAIMATYACDDGAVLCLMRDPTEEDIVYNATTRFWLFDWKTLEVNGSFPALKGGTSNLRNVGVVIPVTGFYRMTFGILLSKSSSESGTGAYIIRMPSSWTPSSARNYMLDSEWTGTVLQRAITFGSAYTSTNTSAVVCADMKCNAGDKVLPTAYMSAASKTINANYTQFSIQRVG